MLIQTLPHTPVETAPVVRTPLNGNIGIVPPWLQPTEAGNTGIVPPWMTDNVEAARAARELDTKPGNTGIVPPWMLTSTKTAFIGNDNIGIVPPWLRTAA